MKRKLTDSQIDDAYHLYLNERLSTYEIAKIYNCSNVCIQASFKLKKLKIRSRSECKQKYTINQHIFDIIDSEEKAYWLGFLYADGNVSKTNRIRLSLAEMDYEILEKFSYFIFNELRIKKYILPSSRKGQNTIYVDVCNKHMANKLAELGCMSNKTFKLIFPKSLEINLVNHFARGYFDGDGCISIYKNKNMGRGILTKNLCISESTRASINILSTKEFLFSIANILKTINVHTSFGKRYKNRNNNNYSLSVSGNLQIERFLDWLYKDSNIFLKRKYDKYIQLKQVNKERLKLSDNE